MLGRVAVTPVFLESNGQQDASTENWNATHIDSVLATIRTGLQWWEDLLATKSSVHELDFVIDESFASMPVATRYEPITRVSNDYALWVSEFLVNQGYTQSFDLEANIRAFNNIQRTKLNADWSFTIFVVNSQNDSDGKFAPGGSFQNAFSFAGGLFQVVPSTRPASTFTHETGHMFWARDEYPGGGNYLQRRGYYNAQNLNVVDLNPTPGFLQQPSIMSSGLSLQQAYDGHVSPASTFAMIGWMDSDGDGIFDVLDVPLKLDGVGRLNAAANSYQFKGVARVQTLPNLNSSGSQNDITLNRISRIEYRINQGAWTTLSSPNQHEVELDLAIPIATGGTIEIRAVDAVTGITSNIFQGSLGGLPDATTQPGIQGFVWDDANSNGNWDVHEMGRAGWTVQLVDANHQLLNLQTAVEPDNLGNGELPSNLQLGATLSAVGTDTDGSVGVFSDARASTGAKVFRPFATTQQNFVETWSGDRQQLRIDFANSTSFVSVDVIGVNAQSIGRLEIYNANGKLLDRVTSSALGGSGIQQLKLGRSNSDIAYAMVKGHAGTAIVIDNLRFGPTTRAVTDSRGRYEIPSLPSGSYTVAVVPPAAGTQATSPANGERTVQLAMSEVHAHIDFGYFSTTSPWQNISRPVDVDNSGFVVPLDALLVINVLNARGAGELDGSGIVAPPYIDVTGDRMLTPLDVLVVINHLNTNAGAGGESEQVVQLAYIGVDASSTVGRSPEAEQDASASASSYSPDDASGRDDLNDDENQESSSIMPEDASQVPIVFSVARLESCGCCYCSPSSIESGKLGVQDFERQVDNVFGSVGIEFALVADRTDTTGG